MRVFVISSFAVALLAACASVEPVAMSDIDPQEAEPSLEGRMTSDGSIVTCRAIVLTGTRFPLKQCKSEKAWEEFDAYTAQNAEDAMDNIQRNKCSGMPGRC